MPEISRTASFGKLNPVAYKAIEARPCSARCAAIRSSSCRTG